MMAYSTTLSRLHLASWTKYSKQGGEIGQETGQEKNSLISAFVHFYLLLPV